jgi:hypothetical protein
MSSTAAWIGKNCRLGSISGTPKGKKSDGLVGYSRAYDLAVQWMEQQGKTWGIVPLSKTAYVSTFGFSESDQPDRKLSISWGGKDSDCGVKIDVIAATADRMLSLINDVPRNGRYTIRTNSTHNATSDNFASVLQGAITELCKRSNRGLTDRARWGFAKHIGSPDDGIEMGDAYGELDSLRADD